MNNIFPYKLFEHIQLDSNGVAVWLLKIMTPLGGFMVITVVMQKMGKGDSNFFGFCHLAIQTEGLQVASDIRGQIRVATRTDNGYYADFRNRQTYERANGQEGESIAIEVGKEVQGVVNKILNSFYESDITEVDIEWNGDVKRWSLLDKRSSIGGEIEGLAPTNNSKAIAAAKMLMAKAAAKEQVAKQPEASSTELANEFGQ
jgi:hypothetical protein